MGQGLESSLYPPKTNGRAGRPVLVALNAHNVYAHGGRLTAGCYRFSPISDSTIVPARRPIVRSSKSVAAVASAPRLGLPARQRLRLTASGPPCAGTTGLRSDKRRSCRVGSG